MAAQPRQTSNPGNRSDKLVPQINTLCREAVHSQIAHNAVPHVLLNGTAAQYRMTANVEPLAVPTMLVRL